MEKLIKYISEHNLNVVVGLVAFISVTFLLIVFFYIKQKKQTGGGASLGNLDNLDNIEGALRRVLEDKNWQSSPMAAEFKTTEGAKGLDQRFDQKIVSELEDKIKALQNELKLKQDSTSARFDVDPKDDLEKMQLQEKLKELESKLAEYAIIEDDIADLNTFKKENVNLKEQLEKLKNSSQQPGSVSVFPDKFSDSKTGLVDEGEAENIFGEFEQVVKNQNASQVMSGFAKKVQEPLSAQAKALIPQAKIMVKPGTAGGPGQVEIIEEEGGKSAYEGEATKDTSQEAELFVKDLKGILSKE